MRQRAPAVVAPRPYDHHFGDATIGQAAHESGAAAIVLAPGNGIVALKTGIAVKQGEGLFSPCRGPPTQVAISYCIRAGKLLKCMMDYRDIVTIEPGKRGGRPCIRHMRIAVADVLG